MTRRFPHLALGLIVGVIYLAGGLQVLDRHLTDLRFRLLPRRSEAPVTVVAIDPASLSKLEVWPWPRSLYAAAIDRLVDAGAARVALAVDFSSRSPDDGEDRRFERSLADARGRVILPVFRQWQEGRAGYWLVPVEPLQGFRAHADLGSINIRPESDGVVRRYGLDDPMPERGIPPLAVALGAPRPPGVDSFAIDFGLDPGSIPRVSFVDVLTGGFDPALVQDRIVIVGTTAVELGNQAAVPVHATVPGPVLQALAYESLVRGRALQRAPSALVLAVTLLLAGLVGRRMEVSGWRTGLVLLLLPCGALFGLSLAVQRQLPVLLDVSPGVLTLAGCYVFALVRRIDQQGLRLLLESMRLRGSETMMRHVVQSTSEAIVTVDEEGRIETFNAAAERMFDMSSREARGRPVTELLPGGFPYPSPVPGGSEDPKTEPVERHGRRRGGDTFVVEAMVSAFAVGDRTVRVGVLRDVTRQKEHEEALERQATHDALTGLPNRILLQRRVAAALKAANEHLSTVAFLVVDLDGFKEVNDTLGHHVGDVLLQRIARRLEAPLRSTDTIARLGGDEFAVLLPATGWDEARTVAERLRGALADPFDLEGLTLHVDMSMGIALYPEHGTDASDLLQRADVALYVAKRTRRAYAFYDPEKDFNSVRHLALKGELHRAVEEDHLVLHYQPKISTRTGRVEGVEALLRWRHPEHGLLPPDDFIPLAEHTGLIGPITRWVLAAALRQGAAWRRDGLDLSVAVNCSARNLLEEDFPGTIREALEAAGLPPGRLTLEITETAIIEDPVRALDIVTELARTGVRISIDDFGTGYSSLEYLRKLPAVEIKIDKSFVLGMDRDPDNAVIVRSTVDLARNLGLQSVAEGVDSEAVWKRLSDLGCDLGQGFLFTRPLPAEELTAWLRRSLASRAAAPPVAASMR